MLPIISLKLQMENPSSFSSDLGSAFEELGFCGITDHTIEADLINDVLMIFKSFFSLPKEKKMDYFQPNLGGARGYTPFKIETPKGGLEPDLKEFWQTGRSLDKGHKFSKWMPPNEWVEDIPLFEEKIKELYNQFDLLGRSLLRSLAVYLDIEEDYFEHSALEGNSVMRSIHYPPVQSDERGERSGAHEDINLITLLIGGHQPGLEILTKKDEWLSINVDSSILICNIGDMLQRFTNHKLISTTHRVKVIEEQKNSSRFSIPFFVHPNPDWFIETLPSCISKQNPNKYTQGILAEDFLKQRLKEIKLL